MKVWWLTRRWPIYFWVPPISINIKVQHLLVPQQALTLYKMPSKLISKHNSSNLLPTFSKYCTWNPQPFGCNCNELLKDSDPEQQNTLQHINKPNVLTVLFKILWDLHENSPYSDWLKSFYNKFIRLSDVKHSIRLEISDNYLNLTKNN